MSNELLQETGLQLVGKPVMHGVFHNNCVSTRDHVLAYLCDVQGSLDTKPKSMEIAETGYFAFEDLPPDTDPGTVRRMQEIVFGAAITENW